MRQKWLICLCLTACDNAPHEQHQEPHELAQPAAAPQSPAVLSKAGTKADSIDVDAVLDPNQRNELTVWYTAVGPRRKNESFGDLIERSARAQLGKPYFDTPSPAVVEALRCRLDSFQCVSLVESSVAFGRCIWRDQPTAECFLQELRSLRYRGGKLNGYPSRLHYYEEWLTDNAQRGHLKLMTEALGGTKVSLAFSFMTGHPTKFPALVDPTVLAAITATEADLSHRTFSIVERNRIRSIEDKLHNGDVIAVIGNQPGILVEHTGLISRDARGIAHLLHASSFRGHVMVSEHDLAQYVLRSAERRGVMVARPIAP